MKLPTGRRPLWLAITAALAVVCGAGVFIGHHLATRSASEASGSASSARPEMSDNARREFFSRPRVISDVVTYAPLLKEMPILRGEGDVDFVTLTDAQWAILLKD